MITLNEVIIQGIGGLGIIASIISFQCNKHKSIMLFRTLNELLFAIQYVFLGAYTGMAMNLVGCVRNTIFSKQVEKGKSTFATGIVFSAFFTVFGIAAWSGVHSILIIVAKIISTFAYSFKNPRLIRLMILFTSSCWLIYNLTVNSIAGALCEAFTLISIIAALIRLDILPVFKKN